MIFEPIWTYSDVPQYERAPVPTDEEWARDLLRHLADDDRVDLVVAAAEVADEVLHDAAGG